MTRTTPLFRFGWIALGAGLGLVALAPSAVRDVLGVHASTLQGVTPDAAGVRMYVFELGNVPVDNGTMFDPPIPVAKGGCCVIVAHLIVHPKGTLIWDTGVVPDALIGSERAGRAGRFYNGKPFRAMLGEVGYRPEDITYLGLSHYHFDHTANANMFRNSTWIVQDVERTAMFAAADGKTLPGSSAPDPSHYDQLRTSKTVALANMDEFDVFGDGSVVVMAAHGHTAGQQVLVVRLPKTGRVMLSGDLYHFREERERQVLPATLEYDREASRRSRIKIEAWAKAHNVPIWIEHDTRHYATLEKAPAYVE